jgi:immune inhibitor A
MFDGHRLIKSNFRGGTIVKKCFAWLIVFTLLFSTSAVGFAGIGKASTVHLTTPNETKLAEMLVKKGFLKQNSTPDEIQTAVHTYYLNKVAGYESKPGTLKDLTIKRQNTAIEKMMASTTNTASVKGKKPVTDILTVLPVVPEVLGPPIQKDRILAIMIEFPDRKANDTLPAETDMFYENYEPDHYADMLFSNKYYAGPKGQDLISMNGYYQQQSGNSYSVEGKVYGWYTAKYPAAYYGGNVPTVDGDDANPRALVMEALSAVAKTKKLDLSYFDQEDRYDLDGDGNLREPDGIIDHLMIFHAGVGEEAGGGTLGTDAIWSHSWSLAAPYEIQKNKMAAYDYTIQPVDSAAGVCAHEYGHDLGLPDEYDTIYSGSGEPIGYWSIMSSGSWGGIIPGTEPTGFSPFAKQFFQSSMNGKWQAGTKINLMDHQGKTLNALQLDEASTKGTENDVIRIDLPQKDVRLIEPFEGNQVYYGGRENSKVNSMSYTLNLAGTTSPKLTFKTSYAIEKDWDYAYVGIRTATGLTTLQGNITTDTNPYENNPGFGITGSSVGWTDAAFDLSAFAGQTVQLEIGYKTDSAVTELGIFIDQLQVVSGNTAVLTDNAETTGTAVLNGFIQTTGQFKYEHYYLLEWRNHTGVDLGLAHILRGYSLMSYAPGLVVWYVDTEYNENWTGVHPGHGYLGVVDADQNILQWQPHAIASAKYQVHDAAFSLIAPSPMFLDYGYMFLKDLMNPVVSEFNDGNAYFSSKQPYAGMLLPKYGLNIRVAGESPDRSAAKVIISVK